MRPGLAFVWLAVASTSAAADDRELDKGSVIFARGDKLYRADAKGKTETELVALPHKTAAVRALRTDARGRVLLADLGGRWWWMPLDGSRKTLAQLPCGEGPAQLPADGGCVVCRSTAGDRSVVYNFATGKQVTIDAPAAGARVTTPSRGAPRRLIYSDKSGVWAASVANPKARTQLAPEAPLRAFLPSPDGKLATGVFMESMYDGRTKKSPVETLVTFALDGQGARRKGIRNGVPIDWSHDNAYVLVQDGSAACLMRAGGGQYKCWRGYTAVSVAPDASYALVLGNRDGSRTQSKTKPKPAPKAKPAPTDDEPDDGSGPAADDVPVALPSGPLALYRAKLDGPYDTAPILVTKIVDGAAVWIPGN